MDSYASLRSTNPPPSIRTIARSFSAALDDAFFMTTPELDNLSQLVAQKYGTCPSYTMTLSPANKEIQQI
jgi:hypothetical protein